MVAIPIATTGASDSRDNTASFSHCTSRINALGYLEMDASGFAKAIPVSIYKDDAVGLYKGFELDLGDKSRSIVNEGPAKDNSLVNEPIYVSPSGIKSKKRLHTSLKFLKQFFFVKQGAGPEFG